MGRQVRGAGEDLSGAEFGQQFPDLSMMPSLRICLTHC